MDCVKVIELSVRTGGNIDKRHEKFIKHLHQTVCLGLTLSNKPIDDM